MSASIQPLPEFKLRYLDNEISYSCRGSAHLSMLWYLLDYPDPGALHNQFSNKFNEEECNLNDWS